MSANLVPFSSAGGFSTTGNVTAANFFGNSAGLAFSDTTILAANTATSGTTQFLNISFNGEGYSYFQLPSDATANTTNALLNNQIGNVSIGTGRAGLGTQSWLFGNDGILTVPGEGILQSINDTVTLRSFNTSTGNANSVYLGTSGGLGFNDGEIGGNWLEIFRNGTEPEIRVPVGLGNLNIQTASGNTPYNWTFDITGSLALPGGSRLRPLGPNLDIFAGTGSYVNLITSDESSYMGVGGAGGYVVTAGGTWDFNTNGNLTAPGNVSAVGNITGGNIVTAGSGGNITLTGGDILGVNIVVTTPTALANLTAVAGGRAFVNDANLIVAGNFGNQVGSGGSNVVPVWSDGSNWYIG